MSEAATVTDKTNEPRRCRGVTESGEPCGVGPELVLDSGFCFSHDAARRSEHKAGAMLGGLKSASRRRKGIDESELGKLETPADAKRWTATIALAVATGALSSAQGRTVLVAIDSWLRAFEADELEQRLAAWEASQGGRR